MTKFKVGDKVKVIKTIDRDGHDQPSNHHLIGKIGKVVEVRKSDTVFPYRIDGIGSDDRFSARELQRAKVGPTKFILKYELESDPIEEFSSLAEVKERIHAIALDENLKKDSIVLYEIKKVSKISVKTHVVIEGI